MDPTESGSMLDAIKESLSEFNRMKAAGTISYPSMDSRCPDLGGSLVKRLLDSNSIVVDGDLVSESGVFYDRNFLSTNEFSAEDIAKLEVEGTDVLQEERKAEEELYEEGTHALTVSSARTSSTLTSSLPPLSTTSVEAHEGVNSGDNDNSDDDDFYVNHEEQENRLSENSSSSSLSTTTQVGNSSSSHSGLSREEIPSPDKVSQFSKDIDGICRIFQKYKTDAIENHKYLKEDLYEGMRGISVMYKKLLLADKETEEEQSIRPLMKHLLDNVSSGPNIRKRPRIQRTNNTPY